jgi:hypothetical protein
MAVCRGMARWGREGKELEEADRVREMMSSLNWGLDITALGAGSPKESLAALLSNSWIDSGTIDMMMSQLAAHVHLDPNLQKTTVVATLNLQMQINKAYKDGNCSRNSVPLLSRYTELFKKKKCTHFFFPVHINANHWVPFLIDFQKETICHG